MKLKAISYKLASTCDGLKFKAPITHVYNPLIYAKELHNQYLEHYEGKKIPAILLGMNPGPWGMAQTGVPFGEINAVKDFINIKGAVDEPQIIHPKRKIEGLGCQRSEVSGRRLWGWAKHRFDTFDNFKKHYFVYNYCPLVFMEESGKNFTPDKLPKTVRKKLFQICDESLKEFVALLKPEWVIGVGGFAEKRAKAVFPESTVNIGKILHPSPASPAANQGWQAHIEKQLKSLKLPFKK